MKLGVCYYPEQWDASMWVSDAQRMAALGLSVVRIAEFAWSRIEPRPGCFEWAWLDRAIDALASAGLQVVLGTPTAAPPHWLVAQYPDVLAVDAKGQPRDFGSRRHYCFSSPAFHEASRRIVTAMAQRYGRHPAVIAWQTDNEYGCHDTVVSYSPSARLGFRRWLQARYGSIEALNRDWGNVFWSMEYAHFDDVGLPVATPAPPNPAHLLAFRRFSSDQVLRYNRMQVDILREFASGHRVLHNFMGFFTEFDAHAMGRDLDIATWDNYPLGFLDSLRFMPDSERLAFRRTGHPDVSAFHHDLYRGLCQGRWWVMEQQAGPVNWAPWNAVPLPGMVRSWTWEAFAHGAELVSYFRWRQVSFAQEQMHSGLNTPDNQWDVGGLEAGQVARELREMPVEPMQPARVALLMDFPGHWTVEALPHSADFDVSALQFAWYCALRRLGLDIDILPTSADVSRHALVVLPCVPVVDGVLAKRLADCGAQVVIGPRSGSKTAEVHIPEGLPPGPLRALLPGLRVVRVEGLRPGVTLGLQPSVAAPSLAGLAQARVTRWRDVLEAPASMQVDARYDDGTPAVLSQGRAHYVSGWFDDTGLDALMAHVASKAGLVAQALPVGLRLRRRGGVQFAIHYGAQPATLPVEPGTRFLLGGPTLNTGEIAAWPVEVGVEPGRRDNALQPGTGTRRIRMD